MIRSAGNWLVLLRYTLLVKRATLARRADHCHLAEITCIGVERERECAAIVACVLNVLPRGRSKTRMSPKRQQ